MKDTNSTESPIVLEDIILYGLNGTPVKKYARVELDGGAIKVRKKEDPETQCMRQWDNYPFHKKEQYCFTSLPIYSAIIERLHEAMSKPFLRVFTEVGSSGIGHLGAGEAMESVYRETYPQLYKLFVESRDNSILTSTILDYKSDIIKHGDGLVIECEIPRIGMETIDWEEIKNWKKWRTLLQAILMPKDLDKAVAAIEEFSGQKLAFEIMYGDFHTVNFSQAQCSFHSAYGASNARFWIGFNEKPDSKDDFFSARGVRLYE